MFEVRDIVFSYGTKEVLKGVSFSVVPGEAVCIVGDNGAGKTTTFYMVVGLVTPNQGKVEFRGEDITFDPVYKRARKGLGYLAQEPSIFRKLSVWNNVMAILETMPFDAKKRKARAEELLAPFDLMKVADQPAYTLSGGERRKLEIARALVRNPAILMLDEPSMGLAPILVDQIFEIIKELHKSGTTILLVEQNARKALQIADRAYVLETGNITLSGTGAELAESDAIKKADLGG